MKNSNEHLLDTWLDSIIEKEISHVIEVFEADEDNRDANYFQEECYELWWEATAVIEHDDGDYWTPPTAEMTEIDIDFTLKIYNAEGDISIERFYNRQINL